jgi:hypothetical protein
MDTGTLVRELREDGQKLVDRMRQNGFEVTTAFWLKPSQDDRWRFYVVSPLVEQEGPSKAYANLHPLIYQMPQPFSIDPLEVKLIGPTDPLAQDILAAQSRIPGPRFADIHWAGNMSIEDAYLYALPSPVSV